jgi:hypothetical protein
MRIKYQTHCGYRQKKKHAVNGSHSGNTQEIREQAGTQKAPKLLETGKLQEIHRNTRSMPKVTGKRVCKYKRR